MKGIWTAAIVHPPRDKSTTSSLGFLFFLDEMIHKISENSEKHGSVHVQIVRVSENRQLLMGVNVIKSTFTFISVFFVPASSTSSFSPLT